jgi:hypothetical protein
VASPGCSSTSTSVSPTTPTPTTRTTRSKPTGSMKSLRSSSGPPSASCSHRSSNSHRRVSRDRMVRSTSSKGKAYPTASANLYLFAPSARFLFVSRGPARCDHCLRSPLSMLPCNLIQPHPFDLPAVQASDVRRFPQRRLRSLLEPSGRSSIASPERTEGASVPHRFGRDATAR